MEVKGNLTIRGVTKPFATKVFYTPSETGFDVKGKVIVDGVNIITKHTKPSAQNTKGGIVKKEAPIAISNVMLWDAKAKAPARITRKREEGKTVRISKKSGEKI